MTMSLLEWIAVNHFKHSTCAFMFIRDLRHIHVAHLARCHSRSLTRHTDISRITSSFHGCISCGLPLHNHKSLKKSHKLNLCQLISTPPCSVFGMLQSSQFHTHSMLVEMAKWSTKDSYSNPLSLLEPLLLVPLLKENEKVFRPSVEEVKRAQDMFRPERGRCIEPMKGVIHFTDLPDPRLPEVAFIGASNVGKSSLIKALFHDPPDVKISISKKPGHTKVVKLYKLRKAFCLVDMPGYGENMPPYYVESVEEYILKRQQLVRTFLLIDGMTGLTEEDRVGIEMMEEFGRPYALVLTKIDLTTRHIILKNLMEINKERSLWMQGALPQPFLVSAKSGAGVAFLRAFVAYVTGNLKVDSL